MESLNNFLASVHYLNHPILSGLSALITLSVGVFVFLKSKKSAPNRIYLWMSITISGWFFGNAFSMFYANNFDLALLWYRIGYTSVCFMCITYYHFYLAYCQKKSKILFWLYAVAVLEIIVLWRLRLVEMGVDFMPNVGIVYRSLSVGAYLKLFGMVKYAIVSLLTALSFLKESAKETVLFQKKRLKGLAIVFFIVIFGTVEWVSAFNIPLHIAWMVVPIFLGFLAYIILKYQLMDIKLIVKKTFFYSLGIALISGIIFGISFLNSWFAENISGFRPWMIPLFSGIVAFIIGRLFWNKSREVDKLKYEFITVAAHKLRTPLTEIKWAADALDEKILSEEERKNLTSGIKSANTRLITLTDELLSIAKTEAGQYQYKFEPVDFEKMVRSIVNDYQRQMQEKGIKLNYDYDKNTPKANLDKIRMSMVVQILLENAIAYTSSADGTISINIKKDKNDILFSIKDNGIGISKEDLLYIFSRFYRTHEAYKTETEGTGIGLFLAKSIIDKHNGKIGVKSEGKDKGSEFWVRVRIS